MKNTISEIKIKYNPVKLDNGNVKINSSDDAFKVMLKHWNPDIIELQEEFKVMLLNNSNEVLGIYEMTKGGMTSTLVDVKLLFAVVLKSCATAIITCHNHPSGKLLPSNSDKIIYQKISDVAKLLDIQYLDNLIISNKGKYSFADENV
ncbi:RadC-like JAB domain-containing protein [Lutibacter agarilyticus]|uniref:RadC-like JAB domain-containing protein n=1 Tax=Lutibacter agarilyticus TaxID=1109740 RepID=A0A238YBW5_9FLAO|nr:JAB domain-containing protein [Lutibacter agarilyticus]SNR68735.1 RadC-like JAB domain-containing protein [Lutibacter agarilyticus]